MTSLIHLNENILNPANLWNSLGEYKQDGILTRHLKLTFMDPSTASQADPVEIRVKVFGFFWSERLLDWVQYWCHNNKQEVKNLLGYHQITHD